VNRKLSAGDVEQSLPETISGKPLDLEAIQARQARLLASARKAVIKEFGSSGGDVAEEGRLERWKSERRIFTVVYQDVVHAPSFQFSEKGEPLPAVAEVIGVFGERTSDWGLALWFTAGNGWLEDLRPVDLLKTEPERVVEAAEREVEELIF
jgi:hypothetical protein